MKKTFTLEELAGKCGARLVGNPKHEISGVNTLEEALEHEASFLANARYESHVKPSKAGVICIREDAEIYPGQNFFLTKDPSRAFQILAELLLVSSKSSFEGIHKTAVIDPSALLGENVTVGPYVVIDRNVKIGKNTIIFPHVCIGFDVTIGERCILYPGSVVREGSLLGNRVILQPGAVIGSCGFGYIPDELGSFQKLEQLGIVILEDDVEIGANTTIDRSRFHATRIRRGTKIDNLCQIAHNVEVGEDNMIAAQSGIAGSARTGRRCMLGGQAGVLGHVTLDDEVLLATRGGVSKSLKKGKYRGSPAIAIEAFHRQEAHVRKLEEYVERIKELEKKVASLLLGGHA